MRKAGLVLAVAALCSATLPAQAPSTVRSVALSTERLARIDRVLQG